jgi:hypothetical protein
VAGAVKAPHRPFPYSTHLNFQVHTFSATIKSPKSPCSAGIPQGRIFDLPAKGAYRVDSQKMKNMTFYKHSIGRIVPTICLHFSIKKNVCLRFLTEKGNNATFLSEDGLITGADHEKNNNSVVIDSHQVTISSPTDHTQLFPGSLNVFSSDGYWTNIDNTGQHTMDAKGQIKTEGR